MAIIVSSEEEMKAFGVKLGAFLVGGEVIELVGDVGAGKTTLVKGIAAGLAVDEDIQSPSYTISRVYDARDDLILSHYDFYRLADAGIMADELQETINDPKTITILEWGGVVSGVLPIDRLTVQIQSPTENSRELTVVSGGSVSKQIRDHI